MAAPTGAVRAKAGGCACCLHVKQVPPPNPVMQESEAKVVSGTEKLIDNPSKGEPPAVPSISKTPISEERPSNNDA